MSEIPQDAPSLAGDSVPELAAADTGPVMESLVSVLLRRARYVVAIALCAYIFCLFGWALVAPTQVPALATASLLLGSTTGGLIAAVGILALLLVCIALSMAIVHPDVPHIGLYCACLGLAALSIRGGNIELVASRAQAAEAMPSFISHLMVESLLWLAILLVAEAATLILFAGIFKNVRWLKRSGSSENAPDILRAHASDNPVVHLSLGSTRPRPAVSGMLANAGALAIMVVIGGAMLLLLMRTELKGQVLFACFMGFGIAAFVAQQSFGSAQTWAVWVGVPLTAIIAYAIAGNWPPPYPGQMGFALARALPIDYICAGVPGAVLGYYTGLRWQIHQIVHEQ